MKFHTSHPALLAGLRLLAMCLTALPVKAADDPGDEYFRGYMMLKDAEKMESEGNLNGAFSLYQQMAEIFDGVARAHPEWQPGMLATRRSLVEKAMNRVQAGLIQPAAPAQAAPAAGLVIPQAGPAQPGTSGPLPSLTEPLARGEQTWRQRMTELETQNSQMQVDLGKWQQWYQWASGEITTARQRMTELERKSATLEAAIQAMQVEVAAGRAKASELDALTKEKLAIEVEYRKVSQRLNGAELAAREASQKLADASLRISELETERNKALAERDAAVKERDTAMTERDSAASARDAAVAERDKLKTQNLGMTAEIESLKKANPAAEEVKKLIAENERLRSDLESAQKQIVTLKADVSRKDQEVAALRSQVATLQGEIATLRQESAAYQTQVADLTLQLKNLSSEGGAMLTPELARENELLREIIMRQLRGQYRQQQAKELVLAELKKMEGVSRDLLEQVQELETNRLALTPDGEKKFTDPAVREMLGQDGGIQGTLIARIPKNDGAAKPGASPVDTLLNSANEAFAAQRFAEAAGLFEDALRADPQNTTALVGLGYARQRENKLDAAAAALKKCLAIDPGHDLASFHLGVTHFKQQQWQDSMASFEKSLAKAPNNARARHYLGIISTKLNLLDRAEREFKTALAIDPAYGEAHFNLAVLYATWDPPQWDKAKAEYEQALKKGVTPDEALEKLLNGSAAKSVSAR